MLKELLYFYMILMFLYYKGIITYPLTHDIVYDSLTSYFSILFILSSIAGACDVEIKKINNSKF